MITQYGRVIIHTDGIIVEGFQYTNVTQAQAEIETIQWVLEKLKAVRKVHLDLENARRAPNGGRG